MKHLNPAFDEASSSSQELKARVVVALVASTICIVCIFLIGAMTSFVVSLILGMLGWREYARMMGLRERPLFHYYGYLFLGLIFLQNFFIKDLELFWVWALWATGFFLLFLDHLIARRHPGVWDRGSEMDWMILNRFILGVMYVFLIFGYVGPLVAKPLRGDQMLLLGLMVTFLGDTGAYFVGRKYGRRKLWPELSPKKTLEGALGGWAASLLAALFTWALFAWLRPEAGHHISLAACLFVGFVAPPLAQAGDFLESLMKRAAGRKDSGHLLPGHGGILDRVDGLVFVLPLVYYLFESLS